MENINFDTKKIGNSEKVMSSHLKMGDYLSNGDIYKVHRYQRMFRWNFKNNAIPLLEDLTFKNGDFFYLGSIVVSKFEDKMKEIVDGQQRTVAITLLLKSISNVLKDRSINANLKKYFFVDEEHLTTKLVELNGQKFFDAILKDESVEDIEKDNKIIKTINDFYNSSVKFMKNKSNDDLINYINWLLNMNLTLITMPSSILPEDVFESINSKGLPLSINELLKNYFYLKTSSLKKISSTIRSNIESRIEEVFMSVSEIVNNKKTESLGDFNKVSRFYQSYVNYKRAQNTEELKRDFNFQHIADTNTRLLYDSIKSKIDLSTDKNIFFELNEILKYKVVHKSIVESNKIYNDDIFSYKLHTLTEDTLMWPLIYFLSEKFNTIIDLENHEISFSNLFIKCINSIYKYYVLVLMKKDKIIKSLFGLINYFVNWGMEMNPTENKEKLSDEIIRVFSKSLINDVQSSKDSLNKYYIWSDELFFNDFSNKIYLDTKKKNIFTIFSIILNNINSEEKIEYNDFINSRLENNNSFTLDHVVPQNIAELETSYLEGYNDNITLSEKYIHSISNLILVKLDNFGGNNIEDKILNKYNDKRYSTYISIMFSEFAKENECTKHNNSEMHDIWTKKIIEKINHEILERTNP